jgi:hypothetical protein
VSEEDEQALLLSFRDVDSSYHIVCVSFVSCRHIVGEVSNFWISKVDEKERIIYPFLFQGENQRMIGIGRRIGSEHIAKEMRELAHMVSSCERHLEVLEVLGRQICKGRASGRSAEAARASAISNLQRTDQIKSHTDVDMPV